MKRWTAAVAVAVIIGLFPVTGCTKKQEAGAGANAAFLGTSSGNVAGLKWSIPKRWSSAGERPMRAATYSIPAAEGDAEPAECAVFFFGTGQGGDIQANIDRWIGQFEASGIPAKAQKQVAGMNVTIVQIAGAYLAPGGPMMQSTGKKENYRLLGAIVEGPQGSVFFKFTGPAKTLGAAEGEFNAMVESLAKM